MTLFNESEEIIIYVDNNNSYECEFNYNLPKSLHLNDNYSCALLECNLPKKIKVEKFKYPKKIYLNCVWKRNFPDMSKFKESDDQRMYHKQTSIDFKDMIFEFEIGPGITSEEEFINKFQTEIKDKFKEKVLIFYHQRFKDAELIDKISLTLPEIIVEMSSDKIRNKQGSIQYHGMSEDDYEKLLTKPFAANKSRVEDLYDEATGYFYHYRIADLYLTLDPELHKILGFNINKYPTYYYTYDKPSDRYWLESFNNGYADFKSELDVEMIYLHCNIVKESHILEKKFNVLRVFRRKHDSAKEIVHYSFQYPVFVPLLIKEIDTIQFKITDERNEIIKFSNGFVSLKIILKPNSYLNG